MFTFHVLLNPLVPSSPIYTADAFNQLAMRWAELFASKGHKVYFYSTGRCQLKGVEILPILWEEDYAKVESLVGSCNNGSYLCSTSRTPEVNKLVDELIEKYKTEADKVLSTVKTQGDFVIHFYGCTLERICRNNKDLFHIDPCVLCHYYLPEFVCFSSKNLQNYLKSQNTQQPPIMSTVVPPFFKQTDFVFSVTKKNYFLYMARIQCCKGANVIFNLAKFFPQYEYVMAGYIKPECDTEDSWILEDGESYMKRDYPNIKMVGFKNGQDKSRLLSECRALIQPSPYPEPFGFNVVEAYLSGTPVITSTLGAFNEIVIQDVTGFRCSSWEDYEYAQEQVSTLDSSRILQEGYKYTADVVYPLYMNFFKKINCNTSIEECFNLDSLSCYLTNLKKISQPK
jgi:glycosyltransferase involved in cell wall biosynthesis